MSNVVDFPVSTRETVVVKLYSGMSINHYAAIIIDPEIGELYPTKYLDREKMLKMIVALSDDAGNRDFDFEVHDLTEKTFFIRDNDN